MVRVSRDLDLLHLPWYEGPFRPRCPLVVNVHDLDTVVRPGAYSFRFRAYYNSLLRVYVRTARRIIVPSNTTQEMVESRWPGARCTVIPYGVDPIFEVPVGGDYDRAPYVLYSGGFSVRKQFGVLLSAFERVARAETNSRLLVTGTAPPEVVRAVRASAAQERIHLVGYVEDGDLVRLYRSASVMVYPSSLEGFGFPVVEAFATGTPVVAANAGSIPEIAGDACVLVRPENRDDLAEAVLTVLRDPSLRTRLVAAGRARLNRYRWPETARQTLAVYRAALE
jgi:alpha-1,3-rhamnosyl/mannosyltransferase